MGRPDPDASVRSLGGLKDGSLEIGLVEDEGPALGGPVLLFPFPDMLISDQPLKEHAKTKFSI
jgi:hypothetical protein